MYRASLAGLLASLLDAIVVCGRREHGAHAAGRGAVRSAYMLHEHADRHDFRRTERDRRTCWCSAGRGSGRGGDGHGAVQAVWALRATGGARLRLRFDERELMLLAGAEHCRRCGARARGSRARRAAHRAAAGQGRAEARSTRPRVASVSFDEAELQLLLDAVRFATARCRSATRVDLDGGATARGGLRRVPRAGGRGLAQLRPDARAGGGGCALASALALRSVQSHAATWAGAAELRARATRAPRPALRSRSRSRPAPHRRRASARLRFRCPRSRGRRCACGRAPARPASRATARPGRRCRRSVSVSRYGLRRGRLTTTSASSTASASALAPRVAGRLA